MDNVQPTYHEIKHGRKRYTKGCRCETCVQANRDQYARRLLRRGKTPRETLSPEERLKRRYVRTREFAWKQQGILNRGLPFRYRDYEALYTAQNGRCEICGCELNKAHGTLRNLSACVDHNANTGEARALLCARCNHMIGNSLERAEILEAGAAYLRSRT